MNKYKKALSLCYIFSKISLSKSIPLVNNVIDDFTLCGKIR